MVKKEAIHLHKMYQGKLGVHSKIKPVNNKSLSLIYTPGVAAVAEEIAKNKKKAAELTIKGNAIAVVSDGSSVLGLGNIGPEAALPIMEGKAVLFKEFANIDAFPICLNTQKPKEIIQAVKAIAPTFGGINLEDIAAPKCFMIEDALQKLGIPVMHDDQHGTAIVVLAALINAAKVVKKPFESLKIVISGAGAAGTAIARLLVCADTEAHVCQSVHDVIICDSKGIIVKGRRSLNIYKKKLAKLSNKRKMKGSLEDALIGADVFIGVSRGNVLKQHMIKKMSKDPIIFALSNPTPEIMPNLAKQAGAKIIATGRSDFPNQVNNVLAFPGVFRAALDAKVPQITHHMKLQAAHALAETVKKPSTTKILPSLFDKNAVKNIKKKMCS